MPFDIMSQYSRIAYCVDRGRKLSHQSHDWHGPTICRHLMVLWTRFIVLIYYISFSCVIIILIKYHTLSSYSRKKWSFYGCFSVQETFQNIEAVNCLFSLLWSMVFWWWSLDTILVSSSSTKAGSNQISTTWISILTINPNCAIVGPGITMRTQIHYLVLLDVEIVQWCLNDPRLTRSLVFYGKVASRIGAVFPIFLWELPDKHLKARGQ